MRGMATITNANLVHISNIRGHEALQGSLGSMHEKAARQFPEGSRGYEFHAAASTHYYDQADRGFVDRQHSVGIAAEPVTTKKGRNLSRLRNQAGMYN